MNIKSLIEVIHKHSFEDLSSVVEPTTHFFCVTCKPIDHLHHRIAVPFQQGKDLHHPVDH